jgi:hypothetical protein
MVNNFGSALLFQIRDNANVDNAVAFIGAERSGADNSGRFTFYTYNTGTPTEKMTILPNGNVGIGTSSPAVQLHVSGTGGELLRLTDTDGITTSFTMYNGSTNSGSRNWGFLTNGVNFGDLVIQSSTTNANAPETIRMLINSSGLVGINENAPTAQLQVKSGATTRVPLIVDSLTGQSEDLQRWNVNGVSLARVNSNGDIIAKDYFFSPQGLSNPTNLNNARVITATTGTTISRNVADTNPALIVNLANSSATANVVVFQKAGSALSQISNAGIFVGQSRPTRTDITANATLALADEGKVLRVNSSSNLTVTIPKNSAVAFPIDTEIAILRYGSGTVSIAPVDGDVTLQSADGERKIKNRYGSVALKKIGTDEWVLVGSLEA